MAFFLVNTNTANSFKDEFDMLGHQKAATYFSPNKEKIARFSNGDVVFLYSSGEGIIAFGRATGVTGKLPYQQDPDFADEEYYQKLTGFQKVEQPLDAASIKNLLGRNVSLRQTVISFDDVDGQILYDHIIQTRTGTRT